jgi:hypothetical protein
VIFLFAVQSVSVAARNGVDLIFTILPKAPFTNVCDARARPRMHACLWSARIAG